MLQNPQQFPELNVSDEVDFIFWTALKNFLSIEHYRFAQLHPNLRVHAFMVHFIVHKLIYKCIYLT